MKGSGYFAIGLTAGMVLGGLASYFYTKNKYEKLIEDEIEAYAEYAETKLEHMKQLMADGNIEEPERDDEEVRSNEGVKKYHNMEEGLSTLMERKPFGNEESKEEENKKMLKEIDGVEEITAEDFINTFVDPEKGPYDQVTLDLLWTGVEDDEDWDNQLYWGYGTDNEELAMLKPEYKTKSMDDILGLSWRWCNDYINEDEGLGSFYVRNHNLQQDIECIVHDERG